MPKSDHFPITNQSKKLGTQNFPFSIFCHFNIGIGRWCKIFALPGCSSAKSLTKQLIRGSDMKFCTACECSAKSHGYSAKSSRTSPIPLFSCTIIPSWSQLN